MAQQVRSIFLSCILYATSLAFSFAQPVIMPSKPVVSAGNTISFSSTNVTGAIHWALAPGSRGSIDSLTGVYTAPLNLVAAQTIGGCQVLPNNHVFNTAISTLPLHDSSDQWMNTIPGYIHLFIDGSWGVNLVDNSTPYTALSLYYTPANNAGYQLLSWPELNQEGGSLVDPAADLDRHIVSVNRNTCELSEVYKKYPPGSNSSCTSCTAQSGIKYANMSFDLASSGATDAAGMFIQPLTLRLDEIKSGKINHALRFTLTNNLIKAAFNWPAATNAYPWGRIPYGTRFRLKSGVDISGLSATAQLILNAFKNYGMFLADGGIDGQVNCTTDVAADPVASAALREINLCACAALSNFEVVDESNLMVSPNSGEVKHDNPYITPSDFAIVTVTDAGGNSSSTSIALQAVTVGVPQTSEWIQSGTTASFKAWVNGNSNQNVTWTISPSIGTLMNSTGDYTAPLVSVPTTVVLTATSVANANASQQITLTILPAGPIRIDAAGATFDPIKPTSNGNYGPDVNGNYWWSDQAGEGSAMARQDDWYPNSAWSSAIQDVGLYYTVRYTWGGDILYRFKVQNGFYKIKLMFAGTGDNLISKGAHLFEIETQGVTTHAAIDLCDIVGACATRSPGFIELNAQVTDNNLYFALRSLTSPTQAATPVLSAFEISPSPLSSNSIHENNSISVYPIPASTSISISTPGKNKYNIHCLNMFGELVYAKNDITDSNYQLNVCDFSKGVYVIELYDLMGESIGRKKIIIQ